MQASVRLVLLATAIAAASGCDSSFKVDVVAQGFDDARAVTLNLDGLQADPLGTAAPKSIKRNTTLNLRIDAQAEAQSTDLVSGASISDGEYVGVRLRFNETEGSVADSRVGSVGNFPIVRASGDNPDGDPFAAVAFMFKKSDNDTVSLLMAMDVPLSLTFDSAGRQYTLDPVVRAMESGDEASVTGTLSINTADAECRDGGVAIYAFEKAGVTPDQRGGGAAEPVASTPVATNGSFSLRFLAPGDYTLAATCEAEEDNGNEDEDLVFGGAKDLRLRAGEDATGFLLSI